MAYTQKGNPFKQKTSTIIPSDVSRSDMDLAKRLNKLRFEMGHIYPITEKDRSKYVGQTAQTEEERRELYNIDPSGKGDVRRAPVFSETESGKWEQTGTKPREVSDEEKYAQDVRFIKTAKKAGGDTFDKLTSLPNKDLVGFQNEVIRVAKPLIGKKLGEDPVSTLNEVRKIDLSGFKPYLEKADIDKSDIKNIITAQINNMPDKNKDGVPDVFEGIKGKVLKSGVNTLIDLKLKDLE